MTRYALIALALAFALLRVSPALAEPASGRYALQIAVVQNGVQIVSTRTPIIEDTPTSASVVVGDENFQFEASLFTVHGDGDGSQMALQAHISSGTDEIAAPTLTFLRGEEARFEMGRADGHILRMAITPID
tara:strand:+ start:1240 stop:1635 length:396 start_codon:yes stop_codon:yes gene_type:complete